MVCYYHCYHLRYRTKSEAAAASSKFGAADLLRGWDEVLHDYLIHPNFFALDAYDGPHFSASWKNRHIDYEAFLKSLAQMLSRGHERDGITRWFKGLLGACSCLCACT
jgi:hypothetical protein